VTHSALTRKVGLESTPLFHGVVTPAIRAAKAGVGLRERAAKISGGGGGGGGRRKEEGGRRKEEGEKRATVRWEWPTAGLPVEQWPRLVLTTTPTPTAGRVADRRSRPRSEQHPGTAISAAPLPGCNGLRRSRERSSNPHPTEVHCPRPSDSAHPREFGWLHAPTPQPRRHLILVLARGGANSGATGEGHHPPPARTDWLADAMSERADLRTRWWGGGSHVSASARHATMRFDTADVLCSNGAPIAPPTLPGCGTTGGRKAAGRVTAYSPLPPPPSFPNRGWQDDHPSSQPASQPAIRPSHQPILNPSPQPCQQLRKRQFTARSDARSTQRSGSMQGRRQVMSISASGGWWWWWWVPGHSTGLGGTYIARAMSGRSAAAACRHRAGRIVERCRRAVR